MSDNSKCETGCQVFTGGEIRHHKDCVYYPDSLTKMTDDLRAQLEQTQKERDAFQKAANSNLSHRLSVEARLRIATEALESIAYWKSDARVCCFPVDCHEVLAKLKAEKLPDTSILDRILEPLDQFAASVGYGIPPALTYFPQREEDYKAGYFGCKAQLKIELMHIRADAEKVRNDD